MATSAERPVIDLHVDRWRNMLTQTDARNAAWVSTNTWRTLDSFGRDTSFGWHDISRGVITQHFAVDELGRRTQAWDGNNVETRYLLDVAGQVQTGAAFDALWHKIAEVDGNGYGATWAFDGWGALHAHTDIGGASTRYTYDSARQLREQTSSRGQDLAYTYDAAGQLVTIDDYTLTLGRDEGYHVAVTDATSSKLLPGTTTQSYDVDADRKVTRWGCVKNCIGAETVVLSQSKFVGHFPRKSALCRPSLAACRQLSAQACLVVRRCALRLNCVVTHVLGN